jgi:uncharacterized membrane protein HdeD (DUF308 family)
MVDVTATGGVHWWAIVLRGIAAILFGLAAFLWPGLTLAVLIALFGAYALVDGVFTLIAAIRGGVQGSRAWLVVEGIVGILAGIVAFVSPGLTAFALVYVIAAWAVVTGVAEILAGFRMHRGAEHEWLLILAGVVSIIFGILLFVQPAAGALALVTVIGAYAFIFGILMLVFGFRARSVLP